jgi:hypothetical protein
MYVCENHLLNRKEHSLTKRFLRGNMSDIVNFREDSYFNILVGINQRVMVLILIERNQQQLYCVFPS